MILTLSYEEGAFYVWEDEKLDEILDPKEAKVFKRYYGVTKNGNVNPALDPQGELEDQVRKKKGTHLNEKMSCLPWYIECPHRGSASSRCG